MNSWARWPGNLCGSVKLQGSSVLNKSHQYETRAGTDPVNDIRLMSINTFKCNQQLLSITHVPVHSMVNV